MDKAMIGDSTNARAKRPSFLFALLLGLGTFPRIFVTDPLRIDAWPSASGISQVGRLLCNPLIADLNSGSCNIVGNETNDVLLTAGLGLLYGASLVVLAYALVIARAKSRGTNLYKFVGIHVCAFASMLLLLMLVQRLCLPGILNFCANADARAFAQGDGGGRIFSIGTFLGIFPVGVPIIWLRA